MKCRGMITVRGRHRIGAMPRRRIARIRIRPFGVIAGDPVKAIDIMQTVSANVKQQDAG